MITND